MEKNVDAFRTISEVAEILDLPQHVLRFWETRFPQIKPLKRAGGRRFYRPDDVELLRTIRQLLYADGYTIKGVQRLLKEHGVRAVVALQGQRALAAQALDAPSAQLAPEMPVAPLPSMRREPRFLDPDEEMLMPAIEPPEPSSDDETASLPGGGPHEVMREAAPSGEVVLDAPARQRLEAALFELAECARILEAARRAV